MHAIAASLGAAAGDAALFDYLANMRYTGSSTRCIHTSCHSRRDATQLLDLVHKPTTKRMCVLWVAL